MNIKQAAQLRRNEPLQFLIAEKVRQVFADYEAMELSRLILRSQKYDFRSGWWSAHTCDIDSQSIDFMHSKHRLTYLWVCTHDFVL